jgi:glycopeptide antibiotics resistance protein
MSRVRSRLTVWVVAALYAAGLLWLVVLADSWSLNRLTVRLYVALQGVAPVGAMPEHYGVLLNVLLFVPLGWLLVRGIRMRWWVATAACGVVSALIEVGQHLYLDRQSQLGDVAANLLGGLVGAAIAALGLARRQDD